MEAEDLQAYKGTTNLCANVHGALISNINDDPVLSLCFINRDSTGKDFENDTYSDSGLFCGCYDYDIEWLWKQRWR